MQQSCGLVVTAGQATAAHSAGHNGPHVNCKLFEGRGTMPGPLRDIRPVSFTEPAELVFDAEICTKVHTVTPTQGQVAKGGISRALKVCHYLLPLHRPSAGDFTQSPLAGRSLCRVWD